MKAPVVLFTYKRLAQTRATIEALQKNFLAAETDVIIFVDGPRSSGDSAHVFAVQNYVSSIGGFKSVTVRISDKNRGLAVSIVDGVTEVAEKYGRVIVLEDDIVTSPFFLQFMNDALDTYELDEKVMSVSGYMYPHKANLPETFFFNVPLCWGWATWDRAWKHYNDNAEFHIDQLTRTNGWKEFNKFGGSYLERQLRKNAQGKMNTWFIYWHATVFHLGGFCLYPSRTLVDNIGFDSSGSHGAVTNAYYSPVSDKRVNVERQELRENGEAKKLVKHFYMIKVNPLLRIMKKTWAKVKQKLTN